MDQDLEKLQEEILAKQKAQQQLVSHDAIAAVQPDISSTQVNFSRIAKDSTSSIPTSVDKTSEAVDAMMGALYQQATVAVVSGDEDVQRDIMDTAKKVVTDKTSALKNRADRESKEALFDNNESACRYFGYDEKTTSRFHVRTMAFWAFVLNTIYIFTIGFFIISPISFICKKLSVVIKQTWLTLMLALFIYAGMVIVPLIVKLLGGS